jgi:chromosome segregation ATPase
MIPETEQELRDRIAELREALERENNRVKELEAERDSIARLGKAVEIENRELKAQAAKEAQETVAMEHELREQIGEFEVSRDELKTSRNQLKERIKELEAERDRAIVRHGDLVAVHMDVMNKLGNSTRELAECRAMNAALVAASAGGQGVRMETHIESYEGEDDYRIDEKYQRERGWSVHSWKALVDWSGNRSHVEYAVMWQRPARPESEGSE